MTEFSNDQGTGIVGADSFNGPLTLAGVSPAHLPATFANGVYPTAGTIIGESVSSGLTAYAGGGQTNALLLTSQNNFFTTVATAGDSAKLPLTQNTLTARSHTPTLTITPAIGWQIFVYNGGANSMQLYGSGTDTINGVATATGIALPAGSFAICTCTASGLWLAQIATVSSNGPLLPSIAVYRTTAATTANANIVPATITGLSAPVVVGTYSFSASLYTTIASGTAGIAINQLLTTAVLGACNFEAVGMLAAGVATQATATATSGTVLYTAANQPLLILIEGSFTVTTAGTFALQMCQNTSNASNSVVNIGSTMTLTRIA